MPKEPNHPKGWNVKRCRHIAETHLDWFVDFVARETNKDQRPLDIERLKQLSLQFREAEASVPLLFEESFFTCNKARLNKAWQDNRQDYLVRLLVEQILPLFSEEGGPDMNAGGLSRKMLPGLFDAIMLALGTVAIQEYKRKCTSIVEHLHAKVGDAFEWDDFFEDADARQILIHILAGLVYSFDDFDQGRENFISTVNRDIPHRKVPGKEADRDWKFNETHFRSFAAHFFVPLTEAVFGSSEAAPPGTDFSPDELDRIKAFLERISSPY